MERSGISRPRRWTSIFSFDVLKEMVSRAYDFDGDSGDFLQHPSQLTRAQAVHPLRHRVCYRPCDDPEGINHSRVGGVKRMRASCVGEAAGGGGVRRPSRRRVGVCATGGRRRVADGTDRRPRAAAAAGVYWLCVIGHGVFLASHRRPLALWPRGRRPLRAPGGQHPRRGDRAVTRLFPPVGCFPIC